MFLRTFCLKKITTTIKMQLSYVPRASKSHNGIGRETPSLALGICGICEFHQSWINRKLVSPEVGKKSFIQRCQEIMASLVEVRFIDESDFANKGNGFILRDCSDWELDSTISLELTDFARWYINSPDSDPNHEISISVLEPPSRQKETNNS